MSEEDQPPRASIIYTNPFEIPHLDGTRLERFSLDQSPSSESHYTTTTTTKAFEIGTSHARGQYAGNPTPRLGSLDPMSTAALKASETAKLPHPSTYTLLGAAPGTPYKDASLMDPNDINYRRGLIAKTIPKAAELWTTSKWALQLSLEPFNPTTEWELEN